MIRRALILALLAIMALWGTWKYSSARESQLFGQLVNRVEIDAPLVALTFDDGPSQRATPKILAMLAEQDVLATFFLVGEAMERNMGEARAIVEAGHELGNHSWSHQRMVVKTPGWVRQELESTDELIRKAGHEGPIHFRPPYGKKLVTLPWVLSQKDQVTITWDVEPESFQDVRNDSQKIVDYVLENSRPGSVILLHVMFQAREVSLQAVPGIISGLKEQGYRFVTVSELLEAADS